MKKLSVKDELTDFLLYSAPEGDIKIEVILNNETVWLSQKSIAHLFGVQVPAISKHLKNIFESGELEKESTISILETVQEEGGRSVKRNTEYFNLDAIISVGYRVNSRQATRFRIWATQTLKEYIIKGFVMDDERLKNGRYFGKDYSENYWSVFAQFVRAKGGYTNRLQIFLLNAVLLMTQNLILQKTFMLLFRINFILQFTEIQHLKLYLTKQMQIKNLWG